MICSLLQEECRNVVGGHKDCFNCHVWHCVVVNGDDPENLKKQDKGDD